MVSSISNGKPGRPPFAPSDQDRLSVHALAAYGIDQGRIATVLSISQHTLRKHFRRELDIALTEATVRIAATLYAKALAGDVVAMIFWLKARAGWSERGTVTAEPAAELDLASMSDAEIEARIAQLRRRTLRD